MNALLPARAKVLWIKEDYLGQILSGRKTVEVRVAYPNIARLRPGDALLLNAAYSYRLAAVRCYASFDQLVTAEEISAVAPDLPNRAALLAACRALYPPEKESLGVVALEIEAQV